MADYYLGIDVGASKSHALVADQRGRALGIGEGGPGNWEVVGYQGLTEVLLSVTGQALETAGIAMDQVAGAGLGIAGYDWPAQRAAHVAALRPLGLRAPWEMVNDAVIGLLAGSPQGWGVALVAGTGCNCRGQTRDGREGRAVGGWGDWSGETAGGGYLVLHAVRAVVQEWTRRGPPTQLTAALVERAGAAGAAELIEGIALERYGWDPSGALLVFQVAAQGDAVAQGLIDAMGVQLGEMALGVVRQLDLEEESFDLVLVGSLYDGSPRLTAAVRETVHRLAAGARLLRLSAPPVVGGVLLGMMQAGLDTAPVREQLLASTGALFSPDPPPA